VRCAGNAACDDDGIDGAGFDQLSAVVEDLQRAVGSSFAGEGLPTAINSARSTLWFNRNPHGNLAHVAHANDAQTNFVHAGRRRLN